MEAVDRRFVIRAAEVVGERAWGAEQPDAQPLAAAVRLEDERAVAEILPSRPGITSAMLERHYGRPTD